MSTPVVAFISQFAADTKHKLQFEPNVVLMAKKLLATQSPIVADFKTVYPYISNDASSIEFRAPNQLSRYNRGVLLKPGLLGELLGNQSVPRGKYAIYDDYCNKVNPPIGKELVTFFLHGQRDKNLHDLIEAEHIDDPLMYTKIRNYQPDKDMSLVEISREIGFLISNLTFPHIEHYEVVECNLHSKKKNPEEESPEESPGDPDDEMETVDPVEYTIEHERELRNNPVMQTFKINAKLTNQYPSIKVAKQILLQSVNDSDMELVEPLFGKKQTSLQKVESEVSDWQHVVRIVDHFDNASIEAIAATPTVRLFENHGCTDNRSLIKMVLQAHSPHSEPHKTTLRYLKKCNNQLDPEFVSAIVNATI